MLIKNKGVRKQLKKWGKNAHVYSPPINLVINNRAKLHEIVEKNSECGNVGILSFGFDCDGQQWERQDIVRASVSKLIYLEYVFQKWGDGVRSYTLHKPSEMNCLHTWEVTALDTPNG